MRYDHTHFNAQRAYGGAINERIGNFLPMVRKLAWYYEGSGGAAVDVDDLIQAGMIALTECAQRHDRPGEDGFAAYAKMRVRGAMIDLLRAQSPHARGAAGRLRRIDAAVEVAIFILAASNAVAEPDPGVGPRIPVGVDLSEIQEPVLVEALLDLGIPILVHVPGFDLEHVAARVPGVHARGGAPQRPRAQVEADAARRRARARAAGGRYFQEPRCLEDRFGYSFDCSGL